MAGMEIHTDEASAITDLLFEARRWLFIDPASAEDCITSAMDMLAWPMAKSVGTDNGLAIWQIRKIIAFIDGRLDERMSTAQLAATVRLSTSHFIRAFKRSFGETPQSYIMRQRVERAKLRMLATPDRLAQIALDCGLADQAHLSRLFRRLQGSTPAAWRRLHLDGAALLRSLRTPPSASNPEVG